MDIGCDNGGVVDRSYDERKPFPFTGTIKKVVFDVKPHLAGEDKQELHATAHHGHAAHALSASTAFIDLDAEPVVFSPPPANGRYLVAQTMDTWTANFASIGTRTTSEEPGHCLIAGPRWHSTPPAGIEAAYRCDTRYAWVLVQIAAGDAQDFPEAHALKKPADHPTERPGTRLHTPAEVPVHPSVDTTATPFDQVGLMDGPTFFQRLAAALKE